MVFIPALGCGVVVGPDPDGAVAVAITSPVMGRAVSDSVEISANAIAVGGAVAEVQFELPDGVTITDQTAPFSTTWDSRSVPDGVHMIRVTAIDADGAAGSAEVATTVANAPCLGETGVARGLPLGIPDDGANGIESTIQIARAGAVAGLSLSLDVRHPFPGDLDISLISPRGTPVSIWKHADAPAEDIVIQNLVLTGLGGEPAAGPWTLRVVDDFPEDAGALQAWSLTVERSCSPGVP